MDNQFDKIIVIVCVCVSVFVFGGGGGGPNVFYAFITMMGALRIV